MLRACTDALNPQFKWTLNNNAPAKRWLRSPNFRSSVSVSVGSETSYTFRVSMVDGAGGENKASIKIKTNQPPSGGEFKIRVNPGKRLDRQHAPRAMDTLFDVVQSSPWRDEHLPLSYRYRAAENRFPQANVIAVTEAYVSTPQLHAYTLPYFDADGTMVVVSVRDALEATTACSNPRAKLVKQKPCPVQYLQRPREKSLGGINDTITGLQARIRGGFLSQVVALAELHSEVSQLNALNVTNTDGSAEIRSESGVLRAEALNLLTGIAAAPKDNTKTGAQDAVSLTVPLLTQVRGVVDTDDVTQTAPLADQALDLTEGLLESRSLSSSASPSDKETAAVGGNVVQIVSSLANIVVAQSDIGRSEDSANDDTKEQQEAEPGAENLRLRLGSVVDTLCRVVTESAVPDSVGLHAASKSLDVSCQKKSTSERRQGIRTRKATRGPTLNLQWRNQAEEDALAPSPFIATAFRAHPAVTLPAGVTKPANDAGRSRRLLRTTLEEKQDLVQLRLQLGALRAPQQKTALSLTLSTNKPLVDKSPPFACQIRGPVDSLANGIVYGGANPQPRHSVLHSVFIDFAAREQRRYYKAELPLSDLEITASPSRKLSSSVSQVLMHVT